MDVIADLEKTSTEVQSSQGPKNQVLISVFVRWGGEECVTPVLVGSLKLNTLFHSQ